MNWSLIISNFMIFIVLSVIRLLFYINRPVSNIKKMIRVFSIPDIRDRDNSGEILVFLYQCTVLLMFIIGFLHQNILQIIIRVIPSIRYIDGYVTFGLTLVSLSLPIILGAVISKIYWSNISGDDHK